MNIWYNSVDGFCISDNIEKGKEIETQEFIGLLYLNFSPDIKDLLKDIAIKHTGHIFILADHKIIYTWNEY